MLRKAALCAVTCTALLPGCGYGFQSSPTTAQLEPLIQERDAVARQYWTSARVFQAAPLGFRTRLEEAFGQFTTCSPGSPGDQSGSAGGLQYNIVAVWQPVGVPAPEQGGRLQDAVPLIEAALRRAGWSPFRHTEWSGLGVVATRQGISLNLDAEPADPAPLERNWNPDESYTVSGSCLPATALVAAEFRPGMGDSYGATPTATTRPK